MCRWNRHTVQRGVVSSRTDQRVPDSDPTAGVAPPLAVRWVFVVVIAVLALLTSGAIGMALAGPPKPADDSVDAGFARDMQTHHAQAVQMALLIRDKSTDPTLRAVAYDIATSQQQQIGQMYGWLVQWGLPQTSSEPPMAWMAAGEAGMGSMDMSGSEPMAPDSSMPGMATPEDLRRLEQSRGEVAEVLFLRLMVAHHRGGVAMARVAAERAERPEVARLAGTIVAAQTAEIEQLQSLLAARGQPPR